MNYKIINEKFICINETSGLIENKTNGIIELSVTDKEPIKNSDENIILEEYGKINLVADGDKKIYVRCVNRISGNINVSSVFSPLSNLQNSLSDGNQNKQIKLINYSKANKYTPISSKDTVLSALGKLEKAIEEVSFKQVKNDGENFSFYYCTEEEYQSMNKIQDDNVIYLVLDEKTGIVVMRCYRP